MFNHHKKKIHYATDIAKRIFFVNFNFPIPFLLCDKSFMYWDLTTFENRVTKSYDSKLVLSCIYILSYSLLSSIPPCEIPQTLTRSYSAGGCF